MKECCGADGSKRYIGVKVIRAWQEEKDGKPGYHVRYNEGTYEWPDVYDSWSPANVFNETYRPMSGLTFGMAIEALKKGMRVTREGWNGKGMWLILIRAGNAVHNSPHGSFDMQDCIGMKTTQDVMLPGWLASQTDMLAEDWEIIS